MADDAPHLPDGAEEDLDAAEAAANEAVDRLLHADAQVEASARAAADAAEPDTGFEERLKQIEDRSRSLKGGASMPEPPEWNYQRKPRKGDVSQSDRDSYKGVAFGIGLAYLFIGPIIAGWLVGMYFDQGSSDTRWQTIGTLIGLFAGFLVVVVMVSKGSNRP